MTISQSQVRSELQGAVGRYAEALHEIQEAIPNISTQQVLKLLLARDRVAEALSEKTKTSEEILDKITELDRIFLDNSGAIAASGKMQEWRTSFDPPPSAWWWAIEPSKETDKWDRFDWVWDALSAGALVLSGSFMVTTFQAFSQDGLGVGEAFGAIAQAAGLAVVSRGALTSDGQQKVKAGLSKINIPERFHSEATFGFSALLLLASYGVYDSVPDIGQFYYRQGQKLYEAGDLTAAKKKYLQAENLDPEKPEIKIALGEIYESLDEEDKALEHYKAAMEYGYGHGFNNAGRVYLSKGTTGPDNSNTRYAETLLRLGLQRISADRYPNLAYQLRRNLGWALLQQEKYAQAEPELKQAIALNKTLDEDEVGGGMSYCFLGQLYEIQGKNQLALENWINCIDFANPETIEEYDWFIEVGKEEIANVVDTSSVVVDLNGPTSKTTVEQAKQMLVAKFAESQSESAAEPSAPPAITDPAQLQALRAKLFDRLDRTWQTYPTFSQTVGYRVNVNSDGAIVSFEAMNQLAKDYASEIPLSTLVEPTETEEPLAQFWATFTPTGILNVSLEQPEL
ncbi:tetratricopeptide repeat protein [Phormidium sp. CCY1219]|uniref:tetratricopeptide repeat protein n=1 Tax=Phormidium sp. CCY1219 TaxID=2886104 RepID=UPI002D1F84D3|nr:tetratricopeptide repeat protein [Phormidium sp. CCY1219]MEB3827229.1 tetratricopeptide repeat protein [Phormidium sp. CCY1219]